jgi:glyoxylase-like metal-dependent hydrolase (beta-lactamase superfamily II)
MQHRRYATTRRRFVAGAAGTLTLAAVASPTRALAQGATPSASPAAAPAVEAPDMTGMAYAFQVGAFNCMSISDGASAIPGIDKLLFGNADPAAVQQALADAGIDPAQMIAQHSSTVIDTGSDLVLVDTGSGRSGLPAAGILIDNLRREKIQPSAVTVVFLTHGHADHVGGNLTAGGNPLYSNARYVMSQDEWDFWTDEARVADAYPDADYRNQQLESFKKNVMPLEGKIELIGDGTEVVSGLTAVAAPGHTPGHMGLKVESEGDTLWVLGDAALHPVELPHSDFTGMFDADPDQTVATRKTLFAQIAGDGSQATFNHFDPFPSLGQIAAEGDAWAWQPVETSSDASS